MIAFLRTTEEDDELVTDLINAAIDFVEGPDGIGVALRSSTWRMSFDAFPSNISIALSPVKSVEAITYLDAAGDVQTLDPDLYHVDVDQRPALVAFHHRPTTKAVPGAVKVEFTAGYETVPADLRQAMLLLIGHWFENREAALVGNVKTIPLGVDRILRKYRVAAFL
ncbi:head-tail connector protein [Brevundimonas sp. M1A4_2e]